MPISYKHSCIFIHIPKTGGTSIKSVLDIPDNSARHFTGGDDKLIFVYEGIRVVPNHAPAKLIELFYRDIFHGFTKFCVVRNPYDRVVSQYLYNAHVSKTDDPFDTWLRKFYADRFAYVRGYQHRFIYDGDKCLVDHILRFETLESDFARFCHDYDIKTKPLPRLNVSKQINKEELLTPENKEFIYNTLKPDFEILGYQK